MGPHLSEMKSCLQQPVTLQKAANGPCWAHSADQIPSSAVRQQPWVQLQDMGWGLTMHWRLTLSSFSSPRQPFSRPGNPAKKAALTWPVTPWGASQLPRAAGPARQSTWAGWVGATQASGMAGRNTQVKKPSIAHMHGSTVVQMQHSAFLHQHPPLNGFYCTEQKYYWNKTCQVASHKLTVLWRKAVFKAAIMVTKSLLSQARC